MEYQQPFFQKRIFTMRYRTLNKNWHFNRVYSRGKSYVHPHVVLYVAKNRLDIILVARGQTPKLKSTQLSRTLGKLFAKAGLPDLAAPQTSPQ